MYVPLQVLVVGMAAEPFVVLLLTALAGGALGVLCGIVAEVTQRIFYSHSDIHVDPSAMAITFVMSLIGVLYLAGVIPNAATWRSERPQSGLF